jgi:hypothetical protein
MLAMKKASEQVYPIRCVGAQPEFVRAIDFVPGMYIEYAQTHHDYRNAIIPTLQIGKALFGKTSHVMVSAGGAVKKKFPGSLIGKLR